jgi:hypothetical protein
MDFPAYAYVPGRDPHPVSDPRGHSYGRQVTGPPPPDPENPDSSPAFLSALDLFNHGYYWEAHELWEALWHACGRAGGTADLLKGLIRLAAAGVKAREGRVAGVRRHARRAGELFETVSRAAGNRAVLGLDLKRLIAAVNEIAADPPVDPDPCAAASPVFALRLTLERGADRGVPSGPGE